MRINPTLLMGVSPLMGLSLLLSLTLLGCGPNLPKARPLPDGVSFEGTWLSSWGRLTLRKRGSKVFGRYAGFREGSLTGTIQGDLLFFSWREISQQVPLKRISRGRGYLRLAQDGGSFTGEWGYNRERTGGGPWTAKRASSQD